MHKGSKKNWIKEFRFLGKQYYPIPLGLNRFLKNYNLIITSDIFFPATLFLYFYCKLHKKKLLITSEKYFYSRKKVNYLLLKIFYKTFARLMLNDRRTVIVTALTTKASSFLFENGIGPVYYFPPLVEFPGKIENRLNVKDDKIRLITISRHVYARNIKSLIGAFKLLKAKYHNNIELTIIGDGVEFAQNFQFAQYLELDIDFIKYIPHNKLSKKINEFDIYIQPARIEATGIAVLEAIASGLIVISTNIGGLSDLVISNENCKENEVSNNNLKLFGVSYVESNSADEYFQAINSILSEFTKKDIRLFGIQAHNNLKKKHNKKRVHEVLTNILGNLK